MISFVKNLKFAQIWIIALVLKIIGAVWLPFANDEAYYWTWGHHVQLSYFDHPGMVGWLFWLGSFVENFGNAARLPGVLLAHVTLLIWREILKPYLDEKQMNFWLIFMLCSPFFGIGSLIVTPDIPLLFFWSLSLLILLRLLENPRASLYLAFGASLGLGFCSKYLIVLFVPIALIWLAASGEWRKVRWIYAPLTIVTGLVFCFPVLYWNYQHEWASFVFQLNHGLAQEKRSLSWPIEYVAGQIGILFPTTIFLATRKHEPRSASFLKYFGWLPFAFFFYTSFKGRVEANWPTMGHAAILSLAMINIGDRVREMKLAKWTIGIWATAIVLIFSQVIHPWVPIEPSKLKTSEFTRFDFAIPYAKKYGDNFYAGSYQMAASVSYKLRHQVYKLNGVNRRDLYDFIPESLPKSDTFYVGIDRDMARPTWFTNDPNYNYSERIIASIPEYGTGGYSILEVTRSAKDTHR